MSELVFETDSHLLPHVDKKGTLHAVRVTIPLAVFKILKEIYGIELEKQIVELWRRKMYYPCKLKLYASKDNQSAYLVIEIPKLDIKIEYKG